MGFNTVWGHVDLQNSVHMGRMKRGVRGLCRNNYRVVMRMGINYNGEGWEGMMCLLDTGGMVSLSSLEDN